MSGTSDDDDPVQNVLVELIDISTGDVADLYPYDEDYDPDNSDDYETTKARVFTDENGDYSFVGVTPGEYYIRYTYGTFEYTDDDGNTTDITSQIVRDDGTKEDVSIDDYKSTIVTSESAKEAIKYEQAEEDADLDESNYDNKDGEWYKYLNDDDDTDWSVAVDDLDRRSDYNDSLTSVIGSGSGTTAGETTSTSITQMYAETPDMSITIENTEENVGSEDTCEYIFDGISFGISEQQEQTVELSKIITNVSLVNTPTVIFDGNPETDNLTGVSDLDGETNGGSTYTRVETTEENIYGAQLTVTYTIEVTNTSDLNYYETNAAYVGWYYMFGEVTSASEEVQIDVQQVIDLYDPELTYSSTVSNIVEVTETSGTGNISSTETSGTGNTYIYWSYTDSESNSTETYISYQTLIEFMEDIANDAEPNKYSFTEEGAEGLMATDLGKLVRASSSISASASRRDSTTFTFSMTKVLSTEDEDMGYVNTAGINYAENATSDGLTEIEIISAEESLSLAKPVKIGDPDGLDGTVGLTYITISPPTGEDKITPIYYVATGAVMLIVLSVGIVVIKKKVL